MTDEELVQRVMEVWTDNAAFPTMRQRAERVTALVAKAQRASDDFALEIADEYHAREVLRETPLISEEGATRGD
jgi:hypothetical protein